MQKKDLSDLITQAEAARLRGVSRTAISKLIARGRLRTEEVAGRPLVYRTEVINYRPSKGGRPKEKT